MAGVSALRVMAWPERLAVLGDLGRHAHAAALACALLETAQATGGPGLPAAGRPSGGNPAARVAAMWRGEGRSADAQAVAAALINHLLAHVDSLKDSLVRSHLGLVGRKPQYRKSASQS